ncbi:hypothetical protein [Agromyces humi]|uniref:hypothetical protein n=1 Tax=Agromyces humi TaxID=1766800 RepID=UPI001356BD20|nr:hypothetical protein [Agromyces humi]
MTVIHRDRTFTVDGETYQCARGGPYGSGDTWAVWRARDGRTVHDDFDTLADIRRYVDESIENGWPLVEPDEPTGWDPDDALYHSPATYGGQPVPS